MGVLWQIYARRGFGNAQQTAKSGRSRRKLVEAYGGKLISDHMLMNGDIDFFIISLIVSYSRVPGSREPEGSIILKALARTLSSLDCGGIVSICVAYP